MCSDRSYKMDTNKTENEVKSSPSEYAEDEDDNYIQNTDEEQKGTLVRDPEADGKDTYRSTVAGKETKNIVVLSISFLCVFTSYTAIQNLQGSLNDEGGLGVISLSCLYGANIISCIIAPAVVDFVGVKRVIIISFVAHLIYDACNFYPSFATLVPASVVLGAFTGPLWTSQGIFLAICAYSYAEESGIEVYTALSKFNGIFWAVSDLSNIIGNIVSSLVLYQSKYNVSNMNASEYCGINDCPSTETSDIIADPELIVVYILLGVFLGCVLAGVVTSVVFLSPIQAQGTKGKMSLVELLFPLFKMIVKTDMKYILPLTLYLAIAEEICFAEITKSYVSCPIGIQNVGYVMTAYGVSITIASFVFSRLAKYFQRYLMLSLAGVVHMGLLLWIYHWIPTGSDTVLIYVLASVWGLGDGLWKTQYNSFLGEHFADDVKCVYAAAEGVKAIGFTATFVYSSLLCMHVKVSIAISFLVVGMILYYFVEIRLVMKKRNDKDNVGLNELK